MTEGVERAVRVALERLSVSQVKEIANAVEPKPRPPKGLSSVVAGASPGANEAVSELLTAWEAEPAISGAGVALALRLGAELREESSARRTSPVWTGPHATGEERLTSATLHSLISGAKQRVMLFSFAAHTLPQVAQDLGNAVSRECAVDVVFETPEDGAHYQGPSTAFASVSGIRRWRWPKEQRKPGASLHAKLLVVDGRRALVGSANLTDYALHRNLEAGVLIRDERVVADLEQHVWSLMSSGILERMSE